MAIGKSTRSAPRFARTRARGRSETDRYRSHANKSPSRVRGKPPAKQERDLFALCVHLRAIFDAIDSLDEARTAVGKRTNSVGSASQETPKS